jgi:chromate transport protein ChrA
MTELSDGLGTEGTNTIEKRIQNELRAWVLIGLASIILMIISIITYHRFGYSIINWILVLIQFSIFIISIIYFIKMLKLKNQLHDTTRDSEEL